MATSILAIDPGSMLGWARYDVGPWRWPKHGTVSLAGDRIERQCALLRWLPDMLPCIDFVVYERPFARGFHATRSLWGMAGVIEAVCQECGVAVSDVENHTWKKYIHGKQPKVTKEMTIAWAKREGYGNVNEHEADALAILRWAIDNIEE